MLVSQENKLVIPIGIHVSWLYFDKDFANARSIGSFNSLGYRKCIWPKRRKICFPHKL